MSFWNLVIKLVGVSILLVGCRQPAPVTTSYSPSPQVVRPVLTALGDSLTEGYGVAAEDAYPAQLEVRLRADGLPWQVVNAGLSGETSSGALSRLDWVLKTKPQAVLLVTGANDGLRGLDPNLTEQNLNAMVGKLAASGVKVMLGGMKAPANLGEDYVQQFEAIYPRVAKAHNVPLIGFFLEGVAKSPDLNLEDGKHPNKEGYAKIVDFIYADVKTWLLAKTPAAE